MSGFDKSEYWFDGAKYDLQTAHTMLETRRLLAVPGEPRGALYGNM